jgi:rhodanese-related sulfurtransferase
MKKINTNSNHFELKNLIAITLSTLLGMTLVLSNQYMRYNRLVPPPEVTEVSPKDAYTYIQNNPEGYIFLDVRSINEYEALHASTSISFPIANMYEETRRETLPYSGKKIYLICTSGRLAGVAYRFLEHYGYTNIEHIDGGIQNWVDAGMPVVAKSLF